MMTKEATFTIISLVVVVRHLGGLLCALGSMVSLFNLSSLHPWGSRVLSRRGSNKQLTFLLQENARTEVLQNQILHPPRSSPNKVRFQTNHHNNRLSNRVHDVQTPPSNRSVKTTF